MTDMAPSAVAEVWGWSRRHRQLNPGLWQGRPARACHVDQATSQFVDLGCGERFLIDE
jgi:hypothetical protein